METQISIPVASHGLHKHEIHCPTLTTHSFFDFFPVFHKKYRKGEKCDFDISLFGRTNAFVEAAMCTGRYEIKKWFVPHRLVMPSWYDYDEKVKHVFKNGQSGTVETDRYVTHGELSTYFTSDEDLVSVAPNGNTNDIVFTLDGTMGSGQYTYFNFTPLGKKVYRILRSLGYSPSWYAGDRRKIQVLPILEYMKLYVDWIYPAAYANDSEVLNIRQLLEEDTPNSLHVNAEDMLTCLKSCVQGYYNQSVFDFAFDNPVGPNVDIYNTSNRLYLTDITNPTVAASQTAVGFNASNPQTPVIGSGSNPIQTSSYTKNISQYMIDGLQSINNYLRRHQLSGARLIERFYADRGEKLAAAIADRSLYLGEDIINLKVGDVENNSNANDAPLGELAGKGVVTSKDMRINVNEEFSDDGYLFVTLMAIPDCPPILYDHPDIYAIAPEDHYKAQFDKLGAEAIPQSCIFASSNGVSNFQNGLGTFGFLNRYYGDTVNLGRLLGDFSVGSLSQQLAKYHGFRLFTTALIQQVGGLHHSVDFIDTKFDGSQFDRFFYSSKVDNLITLLWFDGVSYQNKLPLGDSYDWDDDEDNKRIKFEIDNG